MQVKVFESENMSSALKMVKEALGPDALILSTRTLRKGKLGVFGKPILEVTAAAAEAGQVPKTTPSPKKVSPVTQAPEAPSVSLTVGGGAEKEEISYQDVWKRKKVIDPLEEEIREIRELLSRHDVGEVRGELEELRQMVRDFVLRNRDDRFIAEAAEETIQAEALSPVQRLLVKCGVSCEVAETIDRFAKEKLSPAEMQDSRAVRTFCRATLSDLVRIHPLLKKGQEGQKRIALVGPTGVGKTTTLAKLAAEYLLKGQAKKVALVTIDTFRIAAVEQLKVYGGIMNLPVEVVFTPEELQSALDRHADKDLILIDTAGRSPRDEVSLRDMEVFLGPQSGIENHLVLSSTTSNRGMEEIVSRFGKLPLKSVFFTKLDEGDNYGSLINIPIRFNLPLSFLTHGQRVPEDIMAASGDLVAEYILDR